MKRGTLGERFLIVALRLVLAMSVSEAALFPCWAVAREAVSLQVINDITSSIVLFACPTGEIGTGFIVNEGGEFYIFTASHVCKGISIGQEVGCVLKKHPDHSDLPLKCSLFAFDNLLDLAIYKIPPGNYPIKAVKVTETVVGGGTEVAFSGYPFAIGTTYVIMTKTGMVGSVMDLVVTTKDIKTGEEKKFPVTRYLIDSLSNPGDSGGPVYLADTGEVIGIVQATTGILKDYELIFRHGGRVVDLADRPSGILIATPVKYGMALLRSRLGGK